MDGLVEQNSVLMHNKIAEAGKRNGLINTRNLVAESRDGLVSVYPTPQYQSHRAGSLSSLSCLENGRNDPVQQLLDPNMLQQTVESHYRPNIILYSENVLRSWGESIGSECCETTFIEDRSPTKDSLEYPDSKFIDLSADDIKIHTLSYDVEEEEDFQELEDIVEIEKGKENDQVEVAASLQGAVKKVGTLHFVEEVAKGRMSQLHKSMKVEDEVNADPPFSEPAILEGTLEGASKRLA
ncbi:hypothetical protein QYF61_010756 [Mycteria americana]|uniref:Uncharacterized protein n=1 Tax=Mycteria americana TaxID=33587 RepID=A0AAN7SBY4_MYCAM|nr:hypothetical protein QYF61_010756 [Mycteria americana]